MPQSILLIWLIKSLNFSAIRIIVKITLTVFFISFCQHLFSQKVGLVLSGGGSSGVTHIGVLKALEEYNIPIDYITGTSMGGLVGALYSSGYSPKEIEDLFVSEEFKDWAQGNLDDKYVYYLREKDETASLITFRIATKSIWETSIPTNLISPASIDYGLMEFLAPASSSSNGNFDSLFIPFRCVASDIISKQPIVMKKGQLAKAVRASMSYPFYLSPVTYEDKLLFDGGLYNNFPSDIMYNDFLPDYIIGSNVSFNFDPPTEDNILSQIKALTANNTKYSISCENSLIIEPAAKAYSTFDFSRNKELIQLGYDATKLEIEKLLKDIDRRVLNADLEEKRAQYKRKLPKLIFDKIEVSGLTKNQSEYVRKSLNFKRDTVSAKKLQPDYVKVYSDDKIKSIYPEAIYDSTTNYFTLELNTKKEKDLFVSFGGVFSSRPIDEGFVGLQYNILNKTAISLLATTYFGRLYNSTKVGFRFDIPFRVPFYWKTTFTADNWDYFRSKSIFFEDTKPSFLLIKDRYFKTELGFPIAYKGKILLEGTAGEIDNDYYQTRNFLSTDTTDETKFRNYSTLIQFERNSLDDKQYGSKGSYLSIGGRFIRGKEKTIPGSTSIIKNEFRTVLDWFQLKIKFDNYFNKRGRIRFGVYGEGVYSDQPFFNNYTATVLAAPAFQPLSESKTLFQESFRSHSYLAGGIKGIYNPFNNFQVRLEGYVFQPYKEILQNNQKKATYGKAWATREYILSSSLVYNTPIGPIAINLNYYDMNEEHWSFLFHFGYTIFNKKSLD